MLHASAVRRQLVDIFRQIVYGLRALGRGLSALLSDKPATTSEEMVEIEERIFQGLGLPYRVVDICTGDLGGAAYRKYDLEAWMPGISWHTSF